MFLSDIVFIDTSVFIAENYFAPRNRIKSIAKLAKDGKLRIVMTEITRQEIYKHIGTSVQQSWKSFNKDCRIFRNHVEIDKWRKSTNMEAETEYILGMFDKFLSDTHTKILDYSYCTSTERIFSDYFCHRKPFGEGRKKDQFPDAFVLTSLERYSKEQSQKIIILSKDGDMEGYESERLIYEDYSRYISRKVAEGVALDEMKKALREEKFFLVPRICDAVSDYLDDFRLYQTRLNLTDVSDYSVNEVKVDYNEDNYEIIIVNERYLELEIVPEISFKVDVGYVNYDYAVYDREDSVWYGTEEKNYKVDAVTSIRITLRFYYGKNKGSSYIEIEDIDLTPLSDAIE